MRGPSEYFSHLCRPRLMLGEMCVSYNMLMTRQTLTADDTMNTSDKVLMPCLKKEGTTASLNHSSLFSNPILSMQ